MPKATSLLPYVNDDALRRFWSRVDASGDCWLWTGTTPPSGYGIFSIGYRKTGAHRFAYEVTIGSIPEGLVLDHLCRVTRCVRPDHLEPVTVSENLRRGMSPTAIAVRSGRCHNGHDLTNRRNLWVGPSGDRKCIACARARRHERYLIYKAANNVPDKRSSAACTREDCGSDYYAKGLCRKHYERNQRAKLSA